MSKEAMTVMPKIRYKRISLNEIISDEGKEEGARLCNEGEDEYSDLIERSSTQKFPTSVFFIIGNEFCERFSYYGLKTVLVLYLSAELAITEDSATSFYHLWSALCYFTPLLGAIIADSCLGRYRMIFYFSVVYLIGNITLSLASIKPIIGSIDGRKALSIVGLLLIASGTGGIKPCVSAFGGDQFDLPRQACLLTKFFAMFYFSINAGSLLSTILTPILREDVTCFGGDCFPLAFGVPAILMVLSLVIFLFGTPRYKIVPPEGNVAFKVIKCILYAVCKKCTNRRNQETLMSTMSANEEEESLSWMDLAKDKFPTSLVRDVKILLKVLMLYLPLPIFWALFDQQGSRWTFQATRMNGKVGSYTLKPDQMQVLNPLLIMLLIPFFDVVIYPWFDRLGILTKPLHRMFVGGLLASLAFVFSGILQIQLESQVSSNVGALKVLGINAAPCPVQMNFEFHPSMENISRNILPHEKIFEEFYPPTERSLSLEDREHLLGISTEAKDCDKITQLNEAQLEFNIKYQYTEIVVVTEYLGNLEVVNVPRGLYNFFSKKSTIRVVDASGFLRHSTVELRQDKKVISISNNYFSKGIAASEPIEITPGPYDIFLSSSLTSENMTLTSINAEESSSKLIFLYNILHTNNEGIKGVKLMDINPPSIHMLWLLPQYIAISVGEIMFSITGLEFSFKQAPLSMKSVVQASWLCTTAFGDLIVVIIAQSKLIEKQSLEFFCFAGLMLLDMLLFLILANRFKMIDSEDSTPQPCYVSQQILDSESEEEMSL